MYIFHTDHEIAIMHPRNGKGHGWVTVSSKSRASLEWLMGKFGEALPIYELNRFEFAAEVPIRMVLMGVSEMINDLPGKAYDDDPDWSKFDDFLGVSG